LLSLQLYSLNLSFIILYYFDKFFRRPTTVTTTTTTATATVNKRVRLVLHQAVVM